MTAERTVWVNGPNGAVGFTPRGDGGYDILCSNAESVPVRASHVGRRGSMTAERGSGQQGEGRRAVAEGDRPPVKEAMATVMGDRAMRSPEIVAALEARGWLPNSENPQQYISFMLSSSIDVFERVERGVYRVCERYRSERAARLHIEPRVELTEGYVRVQACERWGRE